MASVMERAVFHLGRVGLASLFILGGLNKMLDPAPSIADMGEVGIPWPQVTLFAVIAMEFGLGAILAAGEWLNNGRFVTVSATLLILYTAAINVLLHPFWLMEGAAATIELSLFFKNVSIMGGLAMIAAIYWSPTGRFHLKS